jgi:hypothetical protein
MDVVGLSKIILLPEFFDLYRTGWGVFFCLNWVGVFTRAFSNTDT